MSASSIEGFLDTYAEHYMASDADAITAMCDVPFLAVREADGRDITGTPRAFVPIHACHHRIAIHSGSVSRSRRTPECRRAT